MVMPIGCARTGTLTVPSPTTNGTAVHADQAHANFSAAATPVNDKYMRITTAPASASPRPHPAPAPAQPRVGHARAPGAVRRPRTGQDVRPLAAG